MIYAAIALTAFLLGRGCKSRPRLADLSHIRRRRALRNSLLNRRSR